MVVCVRASSPLGYDNAGCMGVRRPQTKGLLLVGICLDHVRPIRHCHKGLKTWVVVCLVEHLNLLFCYVMAKELQDQALCRGRRQRGSSTVLSVTLPSVR